MTPQHPNVSLAIAPNRMRAVDLIRKKRDSGEHSREEIDYLISAYTRDEIPDYQMAAWLMAAWIRGLSRAELAGLTEAMLHSGEVVVTEAGSVRGLIRRHGQPVRQYEGAEVNRLRRRRSSRSRPRRASILGVSSGR